MVASLQFQAESELSSELFEERLVISSLAAVIHVLSKESREMYLPLTLLRQRERMNSVNTTELRIRPAVSAYHYAMLAASVGFQQPRTARIACMTGKGRNSNTFIRVEDR